MIVSIVQDARLEGDKVHLTLGMDSQLIDRVPPTCGRDHPEALFGESHVSLFRPAAPVSISRR